MPLLSYSGSTARTRTSPVSPSPLQKPTRSESCEQTHPFIRPLATSPAMASGVIPISASCFLEIGFSLVRARTEKSPSTSDGSVSRNVSSTSPPALAHSHSVILGKPPASVLAPHPNSLPRAVDDSLRARISGGRMTQSGRLLPDADTMAAHRLVSTPLRSLVTVRNRRVEIAPQPVDVLWHALNEGNAQIWDRDFVSMRALMLSKYPVGCFAIPRLSAGRPLFEAVNVDVETSRTARVVQRMTGRTKLWSAQSAARH
jgi:hypothetical protein